MEGRGSYVFWTSLCFEENMKIRMPCPRSVTDYPLPHWIIQVCLRLQFEIPELQSGAVMRLFSLSEIAFVLYLLRHENCVVGDYECRGTVL